MEKGEGNDKPMEGGKRPGYFLIVHPVEAHPPTTRGGEKSKKNATKKNQGGRAYTNCV